MVCDRIVRLVLSDVGFGNFGEDCGRKKDEEKEERKARKDTEKEVKIAASLLWFRHQLLVLCFRSVAGRETAERLADEQICQF